MVFVSKYATVMYNGVGCKTHKLYCEGINDMQNMELQEQCNFYTESMRKCRNELNRLIDQNVSLNDARMLKISAQCDVYTAKLFEISEQMKTRS